jgi:hypothetical protein
LHQAFPIRAIVEKIQENRNDLLRRNITRRLTALQESLSDPTQIAAPQKTYLSAEQRVRKEKRTIPNFLSYMMTYLRRGAGDDNLEVFLFQESIVTFINMVQRCPLSRYILVGQGVLEVLLQVLQRSKAQLRGEVCLAIGRCLETRAFDRWNITCIRRIMAADGLSTLFDHRDISDWGLLATRMTAQLLRAIDANAMAGEHIALHTLFPMHIWQLNQRIDELRT